MMYKRYRTTCVYRRAEGKTWSRVMLCDEEYYRLDRPAQRIPMVHYIKVSDYERRECYPVTIPVYVKEAGT